MDSLFSMLWRTVLMYLIILIVFRLMGKRDIGELSVFDLVVNIMLAELAVMAIEDTNTMTIQYIVAILALMIIQISTARMSLKSKKFRDLIDGSPSVIINHGQIDEHAMRKQRYNFDDLLQQLREKGVRNIADVEFAILEPSGKLSVLKKEAKGKGLSLPLIIDGVIQNDHLNRIQKSEDWLLQKLKEKGYKNISDISFCSYQDREFYIDTKNL
ncbi:DUF421 domain-containing protein [Niallia sp. XMNu-256]|uniref:DUF421 domain-containing protein n=1 Tax=Niallia sp. XMNu-256 TaxID=3082444 RepID=UPI0030D36940